MNVPDSPDAMRKPLRFIDLFAGIGGIRLAFEAARCSCVFSSEWDKYAQVTYRAFFGETPEGDINDIPLNGIPSHDILTAGFPCQPFSLAGVSKKNSMGRTHGFEDPTQGTLFFNIKAILEHSRPAAFLLENVKNLRSHDGGRTFAVIREKLTEAGYDFQAEVIDSAGWVPQHRERIYIVGFASDRRLGSRLPECFPSPPPHRLGLNGVIEPPEVIGARYGDRYTLGPGTWATLERHRLHHRNAGNGFGYGLLVPPFDDRTVTRTLSARYHKDGAEILIDQGAGRRPRRLTPLEVCRLQGFPKSCERFFDGSEPQPVSDTQVYRQFGNSVTVPVVADIAKRIAEVLRGER